MFSRGIDGKRHLVRNGRMAVTSRPRRNADERPRRFTHAVEFSKISAVRDDNKKASDSRPEAHGGFGTGRIRFVPWAAPTVE
jgi:hypothetical protein